jgi:hypothetical protein
LQLLHVFLVSILAKPICDIKAVRESGETSKNEELEENEDSVDPIVLPEADVIGNLSSPRPPHQGKEGQIRNDVLNMERSYVRVLVERLTRFSGSYGKSKYRRTVARKQPGEYKRE